MQITLQNIEHTEQTSRNGKPYTSCKLVVTDKNTGKDSWIKGFGSSITKTWQAGDVVDVDVEQVESNGKRYWNFKENKNSRPSKGSIEYLKEINAKLDRLLAFKAPVREENLQTIQSTTPTLETPQNTNKQPTAQYPDQPWKNDLRYNPPSEFVQEVNELDPENKLGLDTSDIPF